MNLLSAISQVGSLVEAAKGVVNNFKHGTQPAPTAHSEAFGIQLRYAMTEQKEAAVSRFIQTRDADKNGVLSAAELGADAQAFAKLDMDRDGQVNKLELMAAMKPASAAQPGMFTIIR